VRLSTATTSCSHAIAVALDPDHLRDDRARDMSRCAGVLVAALLAMAAGCGTASEPASDTRSSTGVTPPVRLPSGTVPIPLSPRFDPRVSAWGSKILVIGGQRRSADRIEPLGDGALYDVATRRWTAVPAPPLSATIDGPEVTWFDRGFLVSGNICRPARRQVDEFIDVCRPRSLEVAQFELGTRRWSRLPEVKTDEPPDATLVRLGPLAITSRGIVAEIVHSYELFREFAILSDASGRWEKFPDPPIDVDGICGSRFGLVAVDLAGSIDRPPGPDGLPQEGSRAAAAVVISGDGAWRRLPPDEALGAPAVASRIVCGADRVAVISSTEAGDLEPRVLDLATRRWSAPEPVPRAEGSGSAYLAGDVLVFTSSELTLVRGTGPPTRRASPFAGAHRLAGGDGFVAGVWHEQDMYLRLVPVR